MAANIVLLRKKLASLAADSKSSAEAINLIYVKDSMEGISRKQKGKGFAYYAKGEKISDQRTLDHIRKLVIPPAWKNVWICKHPKGHLQATGYDAKGRKQYLYHPLWAALRRETKFSHLYNFGKALPKIRKEATNALRKKGLPLEKVLAAVVSIMQYTYARIGNINYELENGSYGLTTLKDKHASITGRQVNFSFVGKKGVRQLLTLTSRKLARIVQQCKDIPGKTLFQYYDKDGNHHIIDSGMVNEYIKEISGGDFTAKDFRTWFGSLRALQKLKEMESCDTEKHRKKNIAEAIDAVASQLGNSRAVCRKYYIHPSIIDCYHQNKLEGFLKKSPVQDTDQHGLTKDEKVMMAILRMEAKVAITEA